MNRKLNLQQRRCNYKNWPIRRQLMISFLCTTVILQLIIMCVIVINLDVMRKKTDNQAYSKVDAFSTNELQTLAFELGHSLQAHYYHLTTVLVGFQNMFRVFFQDNYIFGDIWNNLKVNPCYTYTQVDRNNICYFVGTNVNNVSYSNVPTQTLMILASAYKDMLPLYMTDYLLTQVHRLVLQVTERTQNIKVYLVFPAQPVDTDYNFDFSSLDFTNRDSVYLSGPVLDPLFNRSANLSPNPKSTLNLTRMQVIYQKIKNKFFIILIDIQNLVIQQQLLDSNVQFLQQNIFILINKDFQLQFTAESLNQIFQELNYVATAEVAATNNNKDLIYAPSYWNTGYQTQISNIFDYTQYSGLSEQSAISLDLSITQVYRMNQTNKYNQYLMVQVPLTGYYGSPYLSSFLNESLTINNLQIDTQTGTIIYFYVMKSEIFNIFTSIQTIIAHEEDVIILLTMCSCISTVAVVFIFTYMIAVKISRPLRKLIATAAQLSAQATQKNIPQKILAELEEIQASDQLSELINAFKNLVRSIEHKNSTQKSTAKQQILQYPLNQYDPNFIEKSKGTTEINWENITNQVDDQEEL